MNILEGISVSPGLSSGQAMVYRPYTRGKIPSFTVPKSDLTKELGRFEAALERSKDDLERVKDRIMVDLGHTEAGILDAHIGLLQDPSFIMKVSTRISRDQINAEKAVAEQLGAIEDMLSKAQTEYIRERVMDIRDVGNRLLRHLTRDADWDVLADVKQGSVIVAVELLPSDTLNLDRSRITAILTERGGVTSHAAILARSMGVPAITGIPKLMSVVRDGDFLIVDGVKGRIVAAPTDGQAQHFKQRSERYAKVVDQAINEESHECLTRDGTRIGLFANINRAGEAVQVKRHNLDGVGLFRTEFLFMQSAMPPSLDKQLRIYLRAARNVSPRPLTIRTMDLGGDKRPLFLRQKQFEINPNLGIRGLRFALKERALFRTQLRAIIRAAQVFDNIRILLPMVVGRHDLKTALTFINEVSTQEGITSPLSVGSMIETPSILFELDAVMELTDFVSIGTNDLAQFMLAADRDSIEMFSHESALNPTILAAIKRITDAGRLNDCPVCVCGEAAGDPGLGALLVGLGIRELSMNPTQAPQVRYTLRKSNVKELRALAARALEAETEVQVRVMLDETFPLLKEDRKKPRPYPTSQPDSAR